MKVKYWKIITLSILLLGFSCAGVAQQDAQFSQYMFNRLGVNPAYAGSSGSICATLMYRNQWLGFKTDAPAPDIKAGSTPTDYLFSFDMPVKFLHGGIGLSVFSDKIGYHNTLLASFDYAFRLYWGPGNLAAAIEVNYANSSLDYLQLVGSNDFTGNYNNPISRAGDPMISSSEASDNLIDFSTGVYYQVPGLYYFGVSIKNLLAAHSSVINFTNARVLYLTGGYEYVLPVNPSFKLKPSALIKAADFNLRTAEIDVSCLLDYQNMFWGGVSYRFQDAAIFMGGLNWNKLRVGLAYDLTTSKLGTFKDGRSDGSLELYLRYCFKVIIPPKPPSVYRTTRF